MDGQPLAGETDEETHMIDYTDPYISRMYRKSRTAPFYFIIFI